MHIETHNNLGQAQQFECTRLVIRDMHNTPVAIALQHSPDHIFIMHAGEPRFENALKAMGIKDTVIVNRIGNSDYPKPPGELLLPQR